MSVRLGLDVWRDGQVAPVGRLEVLEDENIRFIYTAAALDAGRPISLSLPLTDTPVGDVLARAFFDNLLPENEQMARVIDREGLDRADIVGILAHIGGDCTGAISCVPSGAAPIKVPGNLAEDYRALSPDELSSIVQRLADRQPLPEGIKDPSPVAGVQSKLAVTRLPDGRLALPRDDRRVPTTHILKVPRRDEAEEAIQESLACQLARSCGFEASISDYIKTVDAGALLIERFDRVIVENVVYRLHQEDFAQALGLPARLKYERRGTAGRKFDTQSIRSLLDGLSSPAQARETFVLATLFNLAIGNTDNHAKNYGILHLPDGQLQLTPLYDLVPIRLHGNYTHELSYKLGGAAHFDAMEPGQMEHFLMEFGLAGPRVRRFVEGTIKPMLEKLDQAALYLRDARQNRFDDLIGRELHHLSHLLDINVPIRERDYFTSEAVGGWVAGS